jgi:hypothetical protein
MEETAVANSFEGKFGYIESLPDEIREAFMWLAQDVVAMHRKWDLYLGLFGKPESSQVETQLPLPFNLIEESLRTDLTMLIGRLSDNAKFGKDENISFRALLEFYSDDSTLGQLVSSFVQTCKPVTQNRHKLVAHTDKLAKLSADQAMIPQIKKSDIDAINQMAQKIIKHVALTSTGHDYGFGWEGDGGAGALIYWLKNGLDNRIPRMK